MNTILTRVIGIVALMTVYSVTAYAYFNPELHSKGKPNTNTNTTNSVNFREDCVASEGQTFLDINNVRARLLVGGDIWWDGVSEPGYIVPAPEPGSDDPEISSIFAGGVWIGGLDEAENLKIAASEYRNPGVDFFPGPLDPETGLTDLPICRDWDQFFEVSGSDVTLAVALYDALEEGTQLNCDSIPIGLKKWAGRGNPFFTDFFPFDLPDTGQGLGAYWDEDGDGNYNPCNGDFPIIEIRGCEPADRGEAKELVPDQMIFWIYNDAGGNHALSMGELKMNMEVQVQAFAYQSNDEVNDMTFMRYKLINRGVNDLQQTYFGMWVDPDLGCSEDDFVGCDVGRSLAYTYNEDAVDGDAGPNCTTGAVTYGNNIPIIGTDYFRGPLGPHRFQEIDGETVAIPVTEIGATQIDTFIELGMSSFMYYNRSDTAPEPATGDPQTANDYYNYLKAVWLDDTPLTFGGSGYNPGSLDSIQFAFPSDPNKTSVDDWSMCTDNLPIADRRTLQATGPFLLVPGITNELIVGAVWVPDLNYPCPDISRLQKADDLAQALFDNCFDFIDGPDAPDVSIIELDQELILVLSNDEILSNNANQEYIERDIFAADSVANAFYEFEGYRIYQLINANVSASEYDDIDKAIEIAQVDVKNGITTLYNWEVFQDPNDQTEGNFYTFTEEVVGQDEGIRTTFSVVTDRFASGDGRLRNHKEYYFSAVAYGSNQYEVFNPDTGLGQQFPYLEGRRNILSYIGVPRPIVYDNLNSAYGDGPVITRLDGEGSPGVFLDLDDSMYDKILSGTTDNRVVYKPGAGPIDVSIYNPLEVVDGVYNLEIIGEFDETSCALADGARWRVTNTITGQVVDSEYTLDAVQEQLIPEFGLSINVNQVAPSGSHLLPTTSPFYTSDPTPNNAVISTTLEYADEGGVNWFNAIQDDDTRFAADGLFGIDAIFNFLATDNGEADGVGSENYPRGLDPNRAFNDNGTNFFYPFFLTDGDPRADNLVTVHVTPAFNRGGLHGFVRGTGTDNGLDRLNNVDIVFTSDKSKWSRCPVVETASEDYTVNESTADGSTMFQIRKRPSVGRDGQPDGDGTGMSWFPGYAVDVVTGKRLNIFFGENSIYDQDYVDNGLIPAPIGDDMLWNPSSQLVTELLGFGIPTSLENFVVGGNHFVYVSKTEYDEGAQLRSILGNASPVVIANGLKSVTWTFMPIMPPGIELGDYAEDNVIPNDLTAKIRVQTPYTRERVFDINDLIGCNTEGNLPLYEFEISGQALTDLTNEEAESALDNVKAVPNPYYGFSTYESSQFNTNIKITNVPPRSDITIYSIDGKFVRRFSIDESVGQRSNPDAVMNTQVLPNVEWDLKNYAGIPIASGVYLIHVLDMDSGHETTVKWFGVSRKFDPSGL